MNNLIKKKDKLFYRLNDKILIMIDNDDIIFLDEIINQILGKKTEITYCPNYTYEYDLKTYTIEFGSDDIFKQF